MIQGETYTVHIGNNLDILPTLPDNSIDAIVTDPPYELGFMGKKWDSSGIAYSVGLWTECLRVLKPGGHLLSFGGTRTWHRVAVAIEDAGFEVRDSIAWMYGSGFPKSLDISKAIDKGTGENRERQLRFTAWMRSTGLTQIKCAEIIQDFAKNSESARAMAQHYFSEKQQPAIPTADIFDTLRPHLPEVPEEIERLVAERTGIEWIAYKNREVIGQRTFTRNTQSWESSGGMLAEGKKEIKETLPSTPEAKQWEGWGTALKPAFEPIVVARKPLGGEIFVRARIENELKKLGVESISWTSSASGVKQSSQKLTSSSIKRPKTAETFASSVSVREPESTELKIQTSIEQLPSDSTLLIQADDESLPKNQKPNSKNKSLKPMAQTVNAAENQNEPSSHLITSMEVGQSIEEEPLAKSGTNLEGSDFQMVIESFAGIATGLSGLQATVHIQKLSNGKFLWPEGLPEVYKVGNTVAENVLTYGTGGLNIDGSRIGTEERTYSGAGKLMEERPWSEAQESKPEFTVQGRWPANVILDPYTAELLDEQSGVSKSPSQTKTGVVNVKNDVFGGGDGLRGVGQERTIQGHGDTGGASRFFYVAKASKRDRNEGLEGLPKSHPVGGADKWTETDRRRGEGVTRKPTANIHPTVKPTDLMRYLVKLVTPPGGVVLDPFTGSGSTGKAAILEGFRFIGCEMTEDYIPIIEGRLNHAEAQVAEAKEKEKEQLF